jgi:hypothetical protein
MRTSGFVCKQCGNCCLRLYDASQHSVYQSDIDMWRDNARDDILAWIDPSELGNGVYVYDLWIRPNFRGMINIFVRSMM